MGFLEATGLRTSRVLHGSTIYYARYSFFFSALEAELLNEKPSSNACLHVIDATVDEPLPSALKR